MDTKRTLLGGLYPQWANADHTILVLEVLFREIVGEGYLPFSTSADADTLHGREVWEKALAGDFGPIKEYNDE